MYKTSQLYERYREKLITAEEAAEMVHNNSRIHFGLGLGTVKDIDKALAKRADQLWNVLLFVPLGFLLAALCEGKRTVHPFIMVVLASFTIEVTQFLTRRGVFELSDLVLNSLGGLIGVLIIAVPHRRAGRTLLPSCESDRSASAPRR